MPPTAAELDVHRKALTGHCYRMLGSAADAEDAVQEAIAKAWQRRETFDGRASVRTWLTRIATNVCLDALAARGPRVRPRDDGPAGTVDDPLETRPRAHWLEPVPDAACLSDALTPEEIAAARASIRLAFVAALQGLPPRQRAALLLADVLEFSPAEVADTLAMTTTAARSALQRARETIRPAEALAAPPVDPAVVARYVEAFERYDVDALVALLREDAVLSMPPYALWLTGRPAIAAWLRGRGVGCAGSRLLPTAACGSPAFGQYRRAPEGGHRAWSLIVLDGAPDGGVAAVTHFLDVEALFPAFGLPLALAPA